MSGAFHDPRLWRKEKIRKKKNIIVYNFADTMATIGSSLFPDQGTHGDQQR